MALRFAQGDRETRVTLLFVIPSEARDPSANLGVTVVLLRVTEKLGRQLILSIRTK